MNNISLGYLNVNCPWCGRQPIPQKDNTLPYERLLWHCYCGGDPIDDNLNFDISTTQDLKVLGFNVIKDCLGGFLQCGWQADFQDEDDSFYPANWDLMLSNAKKTDIKTLRNEVGTITMQEAKEIVLRYEKLLVFL